MGLDRLSETQAKLLEMIEWFDTFCRDNNLKYYAVGGTLLGAVRHKGFIPWDDDIDVAMPRTDYQKLASLLKEKTIDGYVLETPQSKASTYCYPITKLYDTRTTLVENKRHPLKRGLFIDIFPLDGIGNNFDTGMAHFNQVQKMYNFYLTRVGGIRKGRSIYKNIAVIVSRLIPSFLIDDVKLRIRLDKMCSKYDYEESKWVGNMLGAWRQKEIVPKEIIGNPKEYIFENIKIMGVEDYDGYLSHIYGDWRKLPPKEKQVSHHDFIELDLHKSYLD